MMPRPHPETMKKEAHELHELNTNYFNFSFVFFVCFVDHFHGSKNEDL